MKFEDGPIKAADSLAFENKSSKIWEIAMTSKYPNASLWRMKKVELLKIVESEPSLLVDEKMTRAEIISEILTIEFEEIPVTVITESPVFAIPGPVKDLSEEEEEDDLPPALPVSARIQRIRNSSK